MSKQKLILTGKHGRPSTKEAYRQMQSGTLVQRRQVFSGRGPRRILKNEYYRTYRDNDPEIMHKVNTMTLEDSIVVRWGTREDMTTNKGSIVYNKSAAIKNATDKKHSRELFEEKSVSSPRLVRPNNFENSMLPIIARPLVHSKGSNFVTLNSREAFIRHYNINNGSWYYSEFIDKQREFRIHAAHGKVLAVMEKIKPSTGNIAWNRAQNDTDPFTYIKWGDVDTQNLKCVLDVALEAVKALELDFGGVDVMLKDGRAYVLEVNTSPTLNTSPYVAGRWGMYFDWLFRKEERREHWNSSEFKKGSSLIWKNKQLRDEENN